MRILHVCLANFYIDGYAYQENVLPRMHKIQGHVVQILASTETYVDNKKLEYIKPSRYINKDGIPVHRIPYSSFLPHRLMVKLRCYKDVFKELLEFKPDLIFLHNTQFVGIIHVIRFVKQYPNTRIVADGHADLVNSARSFISLKILHGIIYKALAHALLPYVDKFYGTLPSRVKFFEEVYHIPREKIDFLPFGADDNIVSIVRNDDSQHRIRNHCGLNATDFVLVTGGKFNARKKNILNLMDAVNELNGKVRLLIFGSVSDELAEEFYSKIYNSNITMLGWANEEQSYQYLYAGNVAVFPCLHSTLWEQAAGLGIPCIFHKMDGFTHININRNCILLEQCETKDLIKAINICLNDYSELKSNAERCAHYFSYSHIAMRSIKNI